MKKINLKKIPLDVFKLKHLKVLDLSNNYIEFIPEEIVNLSQLKILVLRNNKIKELPSWLFEVKSLKKIFLGGNSISKIDPSIIKLGRLEELQLSRNPISDFPNRFFEFPSLKKLWLTNCKIKDVSILFFTQMRLKKLYLNQNEINDLPEEILENSSLEGIYLEGNPMKDIPIFNWEGNKLPDLKIYFDSLKQGALKNYKAKLIILGKGEVGKTTLMTRLKEPYVSQYTLDRIKQTHGIQIDRLENILIEDTTSPTKKTEFEVYMWDFGGQEIQRNIHQFFITENALYLLVWSVRNAENKYQYFKEWLNTIETFGGEKSRVILIQNKALGKDANQENIDRESLQKTFPQLKSFANVGAYSGIGFDGEHGLRKKIERQLLELPKVGQNLPMSWINVKKRLDQEKVTKNLISLREFRRICSTVYGVKTENEQDLIIDWLHQIGTILYYKSPSILRKKIILNPQWITQAVYSILIDKDKSIEKNKGRFSLGYVENLLDEENDIVILELMKKFELCFPVKSAEEEENYIAPFLLPPERPKALKDIEWKHAINLEYKYDIMPKSTISRFISRAYNNYDCKNDLYWQHGILIYYKEKNKVLIAYELLDNQNYDKISIKVDGPQKWLLLQKIRDDFQSINSKAKLNAELTYCTNSKACKKMPNEASLFDMNMLEDMREKDVAQIQCMKCYKMVPIDQLLFGFDKNPIVSLKDIKSLVAKAKLDSALDKLAEFTKDRFDGRYESDIVQLQAQFSRINSEKRNGSLDLNEESKSYSKLTTSILTLLSDLE